MILIILKVLKDNGIVKKTGVRKKIVLLAVEGSLKWW